MTQRLAICEQHVDRYIPFMELMCRLDLSELTGKRVNYDHIHQRFLAMHMARHHGILPDQRHNYRDYAYSITTILQKLELFSGCKPDEYDGFIKTLYNEEVIMGIR